MGTAFDVEYDRRTGEEEEESNITVFNNLHDQNIGLLGDNVVMNATEIYVDNSEPLFSIPQGSVLYIFFLVLYAVIVILGACGNTVTIIVIYRSKTMHTVTNMYICSVALADLIISFLATPFQAIAILEQRWDLPIMMCRICPFILNLSVCISVFSMTFISLDRYKAILNPLNHKPSKRTATIIIIIVWIVSTLIALPQAYYYEYLMTYMDNELKPFCKLIESSDVLPYCTFSVLRSVLDYFMPMVIIIFSYSSICFRLKQSVSLQTTASGQIEGGNRVESRKQVEKTLMIVVLLFILCWTPYNAFFILTCVDGFLQFKYINVIFLVSHWLAMSNSCYNPLIYALFSSKFRSEYHQLFDCLISCSPRLSSLKLQLSNGVKSFSSRKSDRSTRLTSMEGSPADQMELKTLESQPLNTTTVA